MMLSLITLASAILLAGSAQGDREWWWLTQGWNSFEPEVLYVDAASIRPTLEGRKAQLLLVHGAHPSGGGAVFAGSIGLTTEVDCTGRRIRNLEIQMLDTYGSIFPGSPGLPEPWEKITTPDADKVYSFLCKNVRVGFRSLPAGITPEQDAAGIPASDMPPRDLEAGQPPRVYIPPPKARN